MGMCLSDVTNGSALSTEAKASRAAPSQCLKDIETDRLWLGDTHSQGFPVALLELSEKCIAV